MAEQPEFREPPLSIEGAADHWNHREDTDYYSQPSALFRLMAPAQQQVLFENTARSVGGAPREIQLCHIGNCLKADPAYGAGSPKRLASLSVKFQNKQSSVDSGASGRRVAPPAEPGRSLSRKGHWGHVKGYSGAPVLHVRFGLQ